jgi:hypothetical protein
LANVLPQLCTDFAKSLPHPAMACLDGALNYASHFPLNAIGPDLGKFLLYTATLFESIIFRLIQVPRHIMHLRACRTTITEALPDYIKTSRTQ